MGKESENSLGRRMSRDKALTKKTSQRKVRKNSKNRKRRTSQKIKKLFEKLRSDSSNTNCSADTVIEIGDTTQEQDQESSPAIVIADDDDLIICNEPCTVTTPRSDINIHPIQCSTPNKSNINPQTEKFNDEVLNLTREINEDSYLTIDLTADSSLNVTKPPNAVIDLVNTASRSSIDSSISMSGDSDVTVINTQLNRKKLNNRQMKRFANGIANMDSSERGKLLEFIAQKIFTGCDGPHSRKVSLHSLKNGVSCATETVEDTYIKEVILGKAVSRNSIGSNIYNPQRDIKNKTGLRMVVIDGSNVAMQHSKGRIFSVKGLKICIDYFVNRGHVVKAFVPHFRCKYGKSTDGRLLDQLERQGLVVYTPSREIQGRMITSYDDRYIVQCAAEFDGVIVSGDNYRDLMAENPRWRFIIENRLLQFTWVGDMIMFPKDPLGRNGPTLEQFLRHPS